MRSSIRSVNSPRGSRLRVVLALTLPLALPLTVAATPAFAADPTATGTAQAAQVSILGSPADTGTYSASTDGSTETTSGSNTPALSLLEGQGLVGVGTLAQDASTATRNGSANSAACAGIAGDGATVAAVGDGNCLSGGDNISIDGGTIDLSGLRIAGGDLGEALAPLDAAATQVSGPLTDAINQILAQAGNPGLSLELGAVQSHCTAANGQAEGGAEVADLQLNLALPEQLGGTVSVLDLPVTTAPNTPVTAQATLTAILRGLRTQLESGVTSSLSEQLEALPAGTLDPILDPLNSSLEQLVDELQQQVVDTVIAQAEEQLKPLTSQLLEGTINKQTRTGDNQIEVTALDLHLLPVLGSNEAALKLATVTCDTGKVAQTPPRSPEKPRPPALPTSVDAGGIGSSDQGWIGAVGLAMTGTAAAAVAGGLVLRRRRTS